jgi:hypothetical protein
MGLIGDALEAMHLAHIRASAIRATVYQWEDREVYGLTPGRWEEVAPRRRHGSSTSVVLSIGGDIPKRPRIEESTWRVWRRQPGRLWRAERGDVNDPEITVIADRRYWRKNPGEGFATNVGPDGEPTTGGFDFAGLSFLALLFDPTGLLPILAISDANALVYNGREAIHLNALPRMDIDLVHVDWHNATKHVLVVDAEFGILLRYEAWLDDSRYMLWDVQDVTFNENLPADIFAGPSDAALIEIPDMSFPTRITDQMTELAERLMEEQRQTMERMMHEQDESQPPN